MALRMLSHLFGGDAAVADGSIESGTAERDELLARSVSWSPLVTGHPAHAARSGTYDLFVDQAVLRVARAHLEKAGVHELYGFLFGRVVEEGGEEGGRGFVLLEEALPASEPMPGRDEPFRFLDSVMRARQTASETRRMVGWYHNHRFLGLELTEQDVEIHLRHFPEPWQCALVLIPDRDSPRGAFFQRKAGDRYFRRSLVPFHEVADGGEEPSSSRGPFQTCVDWKNYVTGADVVPGESAIAPSGNGRSPDRGGLPSRSSPPPEAPREQRKSPDPSATTPSAKRPPRPERTTHRPSDPRPASSPGESRPAPPEGAAGGARRRAPVEEGVRPPRRTGEPLRPMRQAPGGPAGTGTGNAEPRPFALEADPPSAEPAAAHPEVPLLLPPNPYPTLWDRVRRLFRRL